METASKNSLSQRPSRWRFATACEFEISTRDYVVKPVSTLHEMIGALGVRSVVYRRDYGVDGEGAFWDFDDLDSIADHLVLISRRDSRVVGTYRLIQPEILGRAYSESEFDLGYFMQQPGRKLELGRACVHPAHRNGIAMTLLFRGVLQYASAQKFEWLMGCSSVKLEDPVRAAALVRYLRFIQATEESWFVKPRPEFELTGLGEQLEFFPGEISNLDLPPLLRVYLRAGARVTPLPAWDRDFHCLDFFTVFSLKDLKPMFARKFAHAEAEASC